MVDARWDPLGPLDPGLTVLEASAGTGKTHAITDLLVRLIAEVGCPVDRILVVTFTKAATAELKDRMRRRLVAAARALGSEVAPTDDDVVARLWRGEAGPGREASRRRIDVAITRFDQATVSTIHGFCQRMLQQHALQTGADPDLTLVTDTSDLVEDIVADTLVAAFHDVTPEEAAFLRHRCSFTAPALRALAKASLDDPDMRVVPEGPVPRWDDAAGAFRDAWRGGLEADLRAALAAAVVASKAGDGPWKPRGKTYTAASVAAWVDAVSAWVEGAPALPAPQLPPGHTWLDESEQRSKLEPGCAAFTHPAVDALRALCRFDLTLAGHVRASRVAWMREQFAARKAGARILAFQDLLRELALRLGDAADPVVRAGLAAALGGAFDAALIDEFQDTDRHQWTIFQRAFGTGGHHLYLIGDPKQAIYGFRGANVHVYQHAAGVPGARRASMAINWRSDARLLRALNAFLGRDGLFGARGFGYVPVEAPPHRGDRDRLGLPAGASWADPDHAPLQLRWADARLLGEPEADAIGSKDRGRTVIAARVADDIVAMLDAGLTVPADPGQRPLRPGDIAVLVRTREEARRVQRALYDGGVPAVLTGAESVLASEEARSVGAWLDALAAPSQGALRAAASTALFGWTAAELAAVVDGEPAAVARWEGWLAQVAGWRRAFSQWGFYRALRLALDETDAPSRLLRLQGGARRMTNVLHVAEIVHEEAVRSRRGPEALAAWFRARRVGDDLAPEVGELRLERDDDAVRIQTIHASKGLQFDVCFVPFLWDGPGAPRDDAPLVVPEHDDPTRRVLDVHPDREHPDTAARRAQAAAEAFEEGVRLLYVALTRARYRTIVYGGPIGKTWTASPVVWAAFGAPGETPDALADRLGAQSIDDVAQAWAAWSSRSADMSTAVCDPPVGSRWRPPVRAAAPLAARTLDRLVRDPTWRRHSYSALARLAGAQATDPVVEEEGREGFDPDGADAPDPRLAAPVEPSDPSVSEQGPARGVDRAAPVPLGTFPAGPDAGTALHAVLEEVDFGALAADPPGPEVVAQVGEALGAHGFDPAQWGDTVVRGLAAAVRTPLGGPLGALRLADVARGDRLDELRFDLPLAGGTRRGRADRTVGMQAVVDALASRRDRTPALAPWLDTLAASPALCAAQLSGFLTGSIDLVFRASGPGARPRWWVVDHKSNLVGRRTEAGLPVGAFAPDALDAEMAAHHYPLQAHLYAVALHRMLRWRLPDYDYDRDIGGVAYLFVRGMVGEDTPRVGDRVFGVWHDRPPRDVIEAIDRAFEEGA